MNLKLLLETTAKQHAQKTAIVLGERRVSYAELDESSNKVANTLIKVGIKKGDRVAMILPNSPEFVSIYFGIIKAGCIAVPLDPRYKIAELASLFDNCQPVAIAAESPFLEPLIPALSRFDHIKHIIDLGSTYEGQFLTYREIMATGLAQRVDVESTPDDIVTISYTGSNTNHPRGAMLSHQSLVTEAVISGDGFQQTDKDVVMLYALPMFHNFGLTSVLLASVNKGSTIIIVPGTGISIGTLMEAIERERGTMLLGVPYIFALAVKLAKREGIKNVLSSLRLCSSGGAPLPINTIRQFKKYYGFTIADIWGQTEAMSQVTCPPVDGTGRLGSVGKALPGWGIRIVDDNGNELPPNQSGEIIARGPIMKGYYNNPPATAEVIRNGWLHTGDIGNIDEDGYLFITGRKKRMIILKGQNIYPSDIEEVLLSHPKVAEARVMGIPDKLRGEIVRAAIKLKEGTTATKEEIRHFCQEHMADYKLPKQIIFARKLPETALSKTGKESLKESLSNLSHLARSPHQRKIES